VVLVLREVEVGVWFGVLDGWGEGVSSDELGGSELGGGGGLEDGVGGRVMVVGCLGVEVGVGVGVGVGVDDGGSSSEVDWAELPVPVADCLLPKWTKCSMPSPRSSADETAISASSVNRSHEVRIADNMVVRCVERWARKKKDGDVRVTNWSRPGAFHGAVENLSSQKGCWVVCC
jgi:hypothetical protein